MRQKSSRESVKVVCRVRPEIPLEIAAGGASCVRLSQTEIEVCQDEGNHKFSFDRVFGPSSQQDEIFNYCAVPLINDVLSGYNATIFAYGQTASGKTFTMEGKDIRDSSAKGIIPRTVDALFAGVMEADESVEFCFKVTYVEIYCEKVRDLLDKHRVKTNLMIREDKMKGIYIAGVTEEYVTSEDELLGIMAGGALNRAVAATGMNEGSSRSHSVFSITVTQRDITNGTTKVGKLVLVDLAGSETVRKTNASGQQLEEAKTINKSLSALGLVIYALTDEKATHIPYRDSKLTRILQDSLGGNSKTALIVNCSPSSFNASETVSTLRFGTRAKNITNKVVKNESRSVAELEELLQKAEKAIDFQQSHIAALAAQLQAYQAGMGGTQNEMPGRTDADTSLIDQLQSTIESLQMDLEEEREESNRRGIENEKLSAMLTEKHEFLREAGELMQHAQQMYDNVRARCEVLISEKAEALSRIDHLSVKLREDAARAEFVLSERDLTIDTYKQENERLRQEISEMSGDDMRREADDRRFPKETPALNEKGYSQSDVHSSVFGRHSPPPPPPPHDTAPIPVARTASRLSGLPSRGSVLKDINLTEIHDNNRLELSRLNELVESLSSGQQAHSDHERVREVSQSIEQCFELTETKCSSLEKAVTELGKRVKELESQRTRLENDLEASLEKEIQSQLDIDTKRSDPTNSEHQDNASNPSAVKYRSLQQRLEQLVAVHRRLLRKFASMELEVSELRKKVTLRDERIQHLEKNAVGITSGLRQLAERHMTELTSMQEQLQELKVESDRFDGLHMSDSPSPLHHGPRVIRGRSNVGETPQKSMRGGGARARDDAEDAQESSALPLHEGASVGLLSKFLGK